MIGCRAQRWYEQCDHAELDSRTVVCRPITNHEHLRPCELQSIECQLEDLRSWFLHAVLEREDEVIDA